jgi:uncharacterized membrane protein
MTAVEETARLVPATKHDPGPRAGVVLWLLAGLSAAALAAQSVFSATGGGIGALLILGIVFVFWHGARRYGGWGIAIMFVITFVVSNIYENLSISTGFPFGHYHYTHDGTPFIFQVPVTIGLSYFVYGYLAWCLASVILRSGDEGTRSWSGMIIQPVTAAFIMVMWDLVMDPTNSTIGKVWIWHGGGGYNGVPLTNYLGWFLTVWTVFQLFAIVLHVRPTLVRPQPSTGFWAMPILIYGITALGYIVTYLLIANRTVVDATGHSWTVSNIYETSVTVMLFTMFFATYLAVIALVKERAERRAGSPKGGTL